MFTSEFFVEIAGQLGQSTTQLHPELNSKMVKAWVRSLRRILLYRPEDTAILAKELEQSASEMQPLVKASGCVQGETIIANFFENLAYVEQEIRKDVEAALMGDPAAKSAQEIILSYPSILALSSYRIAHRLFQIGVPLLPRMITELAHGETGIDIHPGAQIGEYFFIDHGTGVVIGETAIIGNHVRLYQGVTLGAKSFPVDSEGKIIKSQPRHPIIEDNVIIYAGATLLGRITIGKDSIIGGNVWLTKSMPPNSRVLQGNLKQERFSGHGDGI